MLRPIAERARRLLAHRWIGLVAALLGLALASPALLAGFMLDDNHHRLALLDPPAQDVGYVIGRGVGDLFSFFGGQQTRAMNVGVVGWWADPHARVSFYRPLAALTMKLDYALWPDAPALMHAQNLAWFAVLAFVTAAFYRRFLEGAATAGLAALLFAVDDTHATAILWLAQRNILPAATFGLLALIAHDRWRSDGARANGLGAVLLYAVSLAFGEAGVATLAYLLAYAAFIDRRSLRSRLASLAPTFALTVLWRIVVSRAGYGTSGVDFYIDPGLEPLRFAGAVLRRAPVLFLGQWSPIPAAAVLFSDPSAYAVFVAMGVLSIAVIGLAMAPLLRRDRTARFFAAGTMLSLVPFCATFPHDRVIVFVGIGAMGLVARFLSSVATGTDALPRAPRLAFGVRTLAAALAFVHLLVAPVMLPVTIEQAKRIDRQLSVAFAPATDLAGQTVVAVNGAFAFWVHHLPVQRAALRQSVPAHTHALFPSCSAMRIERTDERTLVLRPATGYLAAPIDGLYRAAHHAFRLGERVRLEAIDIEITALTDDGRPAQIAARFREPLEHPSLRWVQWEDGGYRPWSPPDVGASVDFPAVAVGPWL